MKKSSNNPGATMPTKNNVTAPTVLGNNGQATGNACLSDKRHHDAVCNESKQFPLELIRDAAEIVLLNGEYQDAKIILDLGVIEGHVQAMWALARMLIYGLLPNADFNRDIYPLVHEAAKRYHIPSMWMLARWLEVGIIERNGVEQPEFWYSLLSKLDPNCEHCHYLVDPSLVTKDDNSILVQDVIDALQYCPDEVYEPKSCDDIYNNFFTK